MSLNAKRTAFVNAAKSYEGIDINSVNKADLQNIADSAGLKFPHWITRVSTYKVGRGLWSIPVDGETEVSEVKVKEKKTPKPKPVASAKPVLDIVNSTCEYNLDESKIMNSLTECINECKKTANCENDILKCQKICLNCGINNWSPDKKKKICAWYKYSSKPNAPVIRGYPGDGSILVEWKAPFDGNNEITNYIIEVWNLSINEKLSKEMINNFEKNYHKNGIFRLFSNCR